MTVTNNGVDNNNLGGCGACGAACNDDNVDGNGLIDGKLLEKRHQTVVSQTAS